MGVPGLFRGYIYEEYPEAISDTFPNEGKEFLETIEFDMGGILHSCAKTVYAYDDGYTKVRADEVILALQTEDGRKTLEDSFCLTVTGRIAEIVKGLVNEVNPQYKRVANVVIAMDGVAPFAKIMQQRTRRYRSTLPDEEGEVTGKKKMPPPEGWQTNAITPGTAFVEKFDTYMRAWVASAEAAELAQFKIIYSSYKKRGEGEHKLFGFRRDNLYTHYRPPKKEGVDAPKGILCVWGLDADLILLNLLYNTRRVYIVREREAETAEDEGTSLHAKIVNISRLRDEIVSRMTGITDLGKIDKDSYYSVIRDFVLMTFFLGNDFLPRVMCFRNLRPSLNSFTNIYKQHIFVAPGKGVAKSKVEGFYTSNNGFMCQEDGSIEWSVFLIFLQQIKLLENTNLLNIGISMKTFNQTQQHIPLTSKALSKSVMLKQETKETEEQLIAKNNYTFNPKKFRIWWYNLALAPRTEGMKKFTKDYGIRYLDDIDDMCKLYLQGLQWVLLYYVEGTKEVGKLWAYTYTQSPMMEDITAMCEFLIENKQTPQIGDLKATSSDPVLGPIHQLLSVMPPKSAELIDSMFSYLILRTSLLCYIAPREFKVDYESSRKKHEGLAILPIVNPYEIMSVVTETVGNHKVSLELIGKKEVEDAPIPTTHATGITYTKQEQFRREQEAFQKLQLARSARGKSVGPSQRERSQSKTQSEREGSYKKSQLPPSESKKPYYKPQFNPSGGQGEYRKSQPNPRQARSRSIERTGPRSKIVTFKPSTVPFKKTE